MTAAAATSRRTAKGKKRTEEAASSPLPKGWGEFLGVALLAIAGLMFGGLASYQFGSGELMGPVGRLAASAIYAGFGMAGYLVVAGIVGVGLKALVGQNMEIRVGEGVGFSLATVAGCVLLHTTFPSYRVHGYTAGGLAGELLGEVSVGLFDFAGTYLVSLALLCVGLLASTPLRVEHLVSGGKAALRGIRSAGEYLWEGVVSIAQTQRGDDEDDEGYDEDEAEEEEEEYEDERGEADAYDEAEEEYEDEEEYEEEDEEDEEEEYEEEEYEDEEEEYEDGEYEDEEEEEEEEEEEGEEEDEIAVGEEVARKRSSARGAKKSSKKKAEELPEIVISDEEAAAKAPAEPEAKADEQAAADGKAPTASNGKKAPLRVSEILQRHKQDKPAESKASKTKAGAQEVQYLTDQYELPGLELFASGETKSTSVDKKFVYDQAEAIVRAFSQFKIKGKVTKIHPGPVITRYEFKPEAGTKVSKIQNLENDLAMALEAIRIRILAPIPGKSTVGLEVPNKVRETVYIHENLSDPTFGTGKAALPMVLGKNIVGKPVWINLAKAPHLLVAGATGSGKSVGVNSMICSLLRTKTPEEVRMILIDPKMLEFSIYRDIPHLLLPVITDAEKANLALRWAVGEMERRYQLLSEAKVRDLGGYNKKVPELVARWEADKRLLEEEAAAAEAEVKEDGEDAMPGSQLAGITVDKNGQQALAFGGVELPEQPAALPYIVVIIDEFADLMMVASKEVEANVARIAAKARAAGIHLIVATQRPSVDVITGTIKNNFPSRIAFQVTSDMDSRTILDQKGAKQLLGMGDMLYMDRGKEPERVHGCYVSESEIEKVVDVLKKQAKPCYNLEITKAPDDDGGGEPDKKRDALYDKAVQVVAEAQKVSTSMIQRRLGVGYNRAAKIVEAMEEDGVIGPSRGTTPREVFVSPH